MKIHIVFLKFAILSVILLAQCTNGTQVATDNKLGINASIVNDSNTINQVNKFLNENYENRKFKTDSGQNIEFDVSTLQSVTRDGFEGSALLVSEGYNNSDDKIVYQLGIFSMDENSGKALIVKNETINDAKLVITYFDMNGKVLQQIDIDKETETISFLYDNKLKGSDCGQETADCIAFMYTELGWGSVSWWIGTAIFGAPWAIGTALGCAYAMCIQ